MIATNDKDVKADPTDVAWLVLDIETVPDPMVEPNKDKDVQGPDGWRKDPPFPAIPANQVVSIGGAALSADLSIREFILFGRGKPESAMLWDLGRYMSEGRNIDLVSFNGRSFDIPVLCARSVMHGRSTAWYMGSAMRYRYREMGKPPVHVDLLDQMTDYGAGTRFSLKSVCQMVGLPGKLAVSGSSVKSMWDAGRHEDINLYCLHDVVQTTLLFQRMMFSAGLTDMTRATYRELAQSTLDALGDTPGFAELLCDIDLPRFLLSE